MIVIGLREELKLRVSIPNCNTIEDLGLIEQHLREDTRVMVDSQTVNQSDLYRFKEEHPDFEIIYIVDEPEGAIKAFAMAHNLKLIQPHQVAAFVAGSREAKQVSPTLAFWGVFPRLGTTTIALAVGKILAEQHNRSVGMLSLNGYNAGDWMLQNRDHHLDDLVSFLQHKKLDRDTLFSSIVNVGRLRYLPGLKNQTQALNLEPEHIQTLIQMSQSLFDVVILDLGSVLNTPMALQGMQSATHRYVVANDLISTQKQFFDHYDYVLKPLGMAQEQFMLVGSQLHGKGERFAKSLNLLPVAGIPYYPSIDLYAEQQPEPIELFLKEKQFRKAVETIAASTKAPSEVV